MTDKEPVLLAGGFSSLLTAAGALAVFYGWMDLDEVGLWIALLTVLGTLAATLWARSRVVSENTVEATGMTLDGMAAVAADPNMKLVPKLIG